MIWNFLADFNNIVGIATILGTMAALIALYPIVKPFFLRVTGKISGLSSSEISYLHSLEKDLELKNQKNQ
jgi:hypothetical protein